MPQVATTVRLSVEEIRNLVGDAANKALRKEAPEGNSQGRQISFEVVDGQLAGATVVVGDAKALPPLPTKS